MITPVTVNLSPLSDFRRRGQQGSPPSGAEKLAAAETDHADIAPGSGFPSIDQGAGHLTGIFDDPDAVFPCDLDDPLHWDHAPMKMGDQDGTSAWTDRLGDQFRVEIPIVRINIDQNGPCTHGNDIIAIPDKIIGS